MAVVPNSILDGTKKVLGIDSSYDVFDLDITMHINSVFSVLTQLGVGPSTGFMIDDNTTTWSEFTGDIPTLSMVKSLMFMKVQLMFDPPSTSFAIESKQKMISELEYRLMIACDPPLNAVTGSAEDDTVWLVDDNEPLPAEMQDGDIAISQESGIIYRKVVR